MYGLSRYIICSGLRTTYLTSWGVMGYVDGLFSVSLNIDVAVDKFGVLRCNYVWYFGMGMHCSGKRN